MANYKTSHIISRFMKQFFIIVICFLSFPASGDDPPTGISGNFTFDTKPPVVTFLQPNGGQSFNSGVPFLVQWASTDEQPGINPVSIGIRTSFNGTYNTLISDLLNTGNHNVQPPLTTTTEAKMKVWVKDLYGNVGSDTSDNALILLNGGIAVNILLKDSTTQVGIPAAGIVALSGTTKYNALPKQTQGEYLLCVPSGYGYLLQINAAGYSSRTIGNLTFNSAGSYNLVYLLKPTNTCTDYRIVPYTYAPNPAILEIPHSGIGYAWFIVEGLIGTAWKPINDATIFFEDGLGHLISCKSNALMYNFLDKPFPVTTPGLFCVKIPADIVGSGSPGSQVTFTSTRVNGVTLAMANRKSIIAKVKSYDYTASWGYRLYGEIGVGATAGIATGVGFIGGGTGATLQLNLTGITSSPSWSELTVLRRDDLYAGITASLGPPKLLKTNVGVNGELGGKVSFAYQNEYHFDLNAMQGLEALTAFFLYYEPTILLAGPIVPGGQLAVSMVSWMAQLLISNSSQNGLLVSRISDETGLDVEGSGSFGAAFGFNENVPFSCGVKAGIGVEAHAGSAIRKTLDGIEETTTYLSGSRSTSMGFGINILQPANVPDKSNKGEFFYPIQLNNTVIPTDLNVQYEMKNISQSGSWQSMSLSSGIGSSSAVTNIYHLPGQMQMYHSTILVDNQNLREILNGSTILSSKVTDMGKAAVDMLLGGDTYKSEYENFLNVVHAKQSNLSPVLLKYQNSADDNTELDINMTFEFPVPTSNLVLHFGGGLELANSREYDLSEGYYALGLPLLQTEMPSPPVPQITHEQILNNLWNKITSGNLYSQLLSVVTSQLSQVKITWPGSKSMASYTKLLNSYGSSLVLNQNSIPAGVDSINCKYWEWSETPTDQSFPEEKVIQIRKYNEMIRNLRENAAGLHYGIGGFFKFEPDTLTFGDSTQLNIVYPQSEVSGFAESELNMFWEDTLGVWHWMPSTGDTANNKVSGWITRFSTYTLAPRLPQGDYDLHCNPDSLPSNGISLTQVTSDTIRYNDGTIIPDSTLFTVGLTKGTLMTSDADTAYPGIQINSSGGKVSFQVRSDTIATPIKITCISIWGYARCQTEVALYDTVPPDPPVITGAVAVGDAIILKWDTVAAPDLAGYRIYYDKDSPLPPYNGKASVWGSPSPVNAGMGNIFRVTGLGSDSTYYLAMTAYDISGNESNYSVPVTVDLVSPPVVINMMSDTVENGSEICISATQTITVAGNGQTFRVENGGKVNLIAGVAIRILPNTLVLSGGYLHGYITIDDLYCNLIDTGAAMDPDSQFNDGLLSIKDNGLNFMVFPNPVTDRITILLSAKLDCENTLVKMYDIFGREVLSEKMINCKHDLSLAGLTEGIYLLCIRSGGFSGTAKIIKH